LDKPAGAYWLNSVKFLHVVNIDHSRFFEWQSSAVHRETIRSVTRPKMEHKRDILRYARFHPAPSENPERSLRPGIGLAELNNDRSRND
jgi:hypothetical protein